MIKIKNDCWYAHFFCEQSLIVVFQDKAFKVTIDPNSWEEVIEYGLKHNIPIEQLDFKPRTREDAMRFFELQSTKY